ncbi:hypothetical protein F4809DRAFT_622791 [Biscogniauxia mediterranea]|nr:hypothetical protein F4809DRAFT_622791 [Biscogniauxia mediterranea]
MKLVCIGDNGQVLDLETILQDDPHRVRNLLLDGLFQCQETLPDTIDFLATEQSLRDALLGLQSGQEKYVKNFLLLRKLEQRFEQDARGDLMRLSFRHGGAIAVLAVFYATLDAHRNLRNRKNLEFLAKCSEPSKTGLMKRASHYPCSESVVTWLNGVFDRLGPESHALACILEWLGTPRVPGSLFRHARVESKTWGSEGEVVSIGPPLVSFLLNESMFNIALSRLHFIGFTRLVGDDIDPDSGVFKQLQQRFRENMWLVESVRIICHIFPKDTAIEPESSRGKRETLLPYLDRISSLVDPQSLSQLEPACIMQLIDTCLSASYVRDYAWKTRMLNLATLAQGMLRDETNDVRFLRAKLSLRKAWVAYLYEARSEWSGSKVVVRIEDPRTSALSAAKSVLQARECMSFNAPMLALDYLSRSSTAWQGSCSTLQKIQNEEVQLMRARIFRFDGRFEEALYTLQPLTMQNSRVTVLFGAVLCELGRHDEAIEMLQSNLLQQTSPRIQRQLQLALAFAYLYRYMHLYLHAKVTELITLQESRRLFHCVESPPCDSLFDKINQLSRLLGVAACYHLSRDDHAALHAWKEALQASRSFLPIGYTDLIIHYSMNDLYLSHPATPPSDLLDDPRSLAQRTDRQHHFVGFGTLWPDILGRWSKERDQDPLIPVRDEI